MTGTAAGSGATGDENPFAAPAGPAPQDARAPYPPAQLPPPYPAPGQAAGGSGFAQPGPGAYGPAPYGAPHQDGAPHQYGAAQQYGPGYGVPAYYGGPGGAPPARRRGRVWLWVLGGLLVTAAVVAGVVLLVRLAGSTLAMDKGDDPVMDELWAQCEDDDWQACDDLFDRSMPGSEYEEFADSCGGDSEGGTYCTDLFGEAWPSRYGDDKVMDRLWDGCADAEWLTCDHLYVVAPTGSEYEEFGATCGDRGPAEGSCVQRYGEPVGDPQDAAAGEG